MKKQRESTMPRKIRIGLIGCGQIGNAHMRNYAKIEDAVVVACCDLIQERADQVSNDFDVPDTYLDYKDLLKRDDIDSVDVCVHNRSHMELSIAGLQAGKNVYCEKPMSWTYPEAKKMYNTAKETGQMLHIQLGTLYGIGTRAAKRLIDDGALGDVYYGKFTQYRRRGRPFVDGYGRKEFVNSDTSGGGAMLDMAVYHISRMVYLLGNPDVLTVSGSTFQMLENMYADRREAAGYNVEELGMGLVRLAGGITFMLEEAWAIQSENPASDFVYGSKAGIKVDPLTFYSTICDMEMDATVDLKALDFRWNQCLPDTKYYTSSQGHWIAAQQGLVPLLDTAGIAIKTSLITEGIYISNYLGREVTMEEIENAAPGFGRV